MTNINKCLLIVSLVFTFCGYSISQTLPSEEKVTVETEEIKLNVSAFNSADEFVSDVKKDDLIISEDGRLQQASSVRRTRANVLIVLDTGSEMRSNLSTTRTAAKNLVKSLQNEDRISVFQYGDRVEVLSDWTTDKMQLYDILDKKLAFGRRSVLNQALDSAISHFYKSPIENRHLVLITGGIDSLNDSALRNSVTARLLASDINVHVVSYTNLQKNSINAGQEIFIQGEPKPQRLPEEVVETLPDYKGSGKRKRISPRDMARMPRLGSITFDRERVKRASKDVKELEAGEQFIAQIAGNTNGEVLMPETFNEIIEKIAALAKIIDSNYVVTYVPKRPLKESAKGEIRHIEVTSKRDGLEVKASRKFSVEANK